MRDEAPRAARPAHLPGARFDCRAADAATCGTHSSAIDVGAMHDAVLAVHLVVGPDRAVVVQSSSRPAVSPAFAEWLERQTELPTELVTDDEQFRAVLVSLGSLGVVFSAIIEAVPAYRLQPRVKRYRRWDPELWQVIERLHTSAAFPDRPDRPFHLDVVFNPYGAGEGSAWLTAMWATPAPGAAPEFAQPLPLAIPSDLMGLFDEYSPSGECSESASRPAVRQERTTRRRAAQCPRALDQRDDDESPAGQRAGRGR